jgi:hypothetical protein
LYGNRRAQTYKLIKYIVVNLVKDRVLILNRLWGLEKRLFNTSGRCLAFFLRGLYRRFYHKNAFLTLDPKFHTLLERSRFEVTVREFAQLWGNLTRIIKKSLKLQDIPVHLHEEVADQLLALADFFGPSPDVRIRILLNLATLHNNPSWLALSKMHSWPAESAVAYFHAGALIAEILSTTSGSVSSISAATFLNACPSARKEAAFTDAVREIRKQTPKLVGFCDSQYFCEVALFAMVQDGVAVCRASNFFGICQRAMIVSASLMQARGLWKLFERTLNSIRELKKEATAAGICALETFWFAIFENGDRYVYHESGFMQLALFAESIEKRAEYVAGGRKVNVVKTGYELDRATANKREFRVFVRKIDPYLTPEENRNHRSVFERSFGASRFSYDRPNEDGGATRTIITLPHGLPSANSRILIPKDGIEIIELKPIACACIDLQKHITDLNDALDVGEIRILEPQIKGVLLTEVQEGWKAYPERFLQGSVDDENTMEMRRLLSQMLETLERSVEFHGKDPEPLRRPLHEKFSAALDPMRFAMRPFIGPHYNLPSSK